MIYINEFKPFDSTKGNTIEMFNEGTTTLLMIFTLCLTDVVTSVKF